MYAVELDVASLDILPLNLSIDADDELSSSLHTTQAALASETNRAQEAENTLRSDINQETTRAIGIENNLQTAINNEAYRASSAETKPGVMMWLCTSITP